jgi:hypothetical protein
MRACQVPSTPPRLPLLLGFLNIFQFEDKEEAVWLLVGMRWHEVEFVLVVYQVRL